METLMLIVFGASLTGLITSVVVMVKLLTSKNRNSLI
jgi:hypothetical protein